MESGNGVHLEDENGVVNVETDVVVVENSTEVSESCEDVNGTKMMNSVEVTSNVGTSKNNKVAKNGPKGSVVARKPKSQLTESLSFPAKPRNSDAMRSSMDGHPGKPRAPLSNGNAMNSANRRASTGVKAKETGSTNGNRRATLDSGPSVRLSRVTKVF